MLDWYGWPFDPIGFDEARARFGMENMARRRRGPLASHRSGSRRPKRFAHGIAYPAEKRARSSRMTGGDKMPMALQHSADKAMQGQLWSAVEFRSFRNEDRVRVEVLRAVVTH